jgi:hypothetical protein
VGVFYHRFYTRIGVIMKKLICVALLSAVVGGCAVLGCCDRKHIENAIYKEVLDPDHSMGIWVVPVEPVPYPSPMPVPSPYPPEPLEEDPWCMLHGLRRV